MRGTVAAKPVEVAFVAVVPAEEQVAVGAVELRQVRRDAAVGDDGSRLVGRLERPLHPAVEDGLVPRGHLLAEHVARDRGAERLLAGVVGGDRLVVRAPHRDAGVVAQQVDGLAGLAHGLLADGARVPPLQREVLPHQHAQLVGGVVQLGPGDVPVHADQVEPGFARELHVAAHLRRRGVGQRLAGGRDVRRPSRTAARR